MESGYICQGELKGLLSGDSVPSFMCDIEACPCLTPHTINPVPSLIFGKLHSVFPALSLSCTCVLFFKFFRECRWLLLTRQLWPPLLFTLPLQERALSFKMSLGACHHLDHVAFLIISRISMWTCNEQSEEAAFLNWQMGESQEEKQLLSFPPGHFLPFYFA